MVFGRPAIRLCTGPLFPPAVESRPRTRLRKTAKMAGALLPLLRRQPHPVLRAATPPYAPPHSRPGHRTDDPHLSAPSQAGRHPTGTPGHLGFSFDSDHRHVPSASTLRGWRHGELFGSRPSMRIATLERTRPAWTRCLTRLSRWRSEDLVTVLARRCDAAPEWCAACEEIRPATTSSSWLRRAPAGPAARVVDGRGRRPTVSSTRDYLPSVRRDEPLAGAGRVALDLSATDLLDLGLSPSPCLRERTESLDGAASPRSTAVGSLSCPAAPDLVLDRSFTLRRAAETARRDCRGPSMASRRRHSLAPQRAELSRDWPRVVIDQLTRKLGFTKLSRFATSWHREARTLAHFSRHRTAGSSGST